MTKICSWMAQVEKPARYTGSEFQMVKKNPEGRVRFALAFPDTYEVGMSHLGSRILYHVLNHREDVFCERCFAPWTDAEEKMRQQGEPLYALESGDALGAFDLIGFPLLYEMTYTNVLNMLELANIPLYAAQRGEEQPIIVAGGPCAYCAEPMAPFFDLMMLGDGEESILELVDHYQRAKKEGLSKREFLESCKDLEGIYVPSLYEVSYHEDGTIQRIQAQKGAPERVRRKFLLDLDHADYPTDPIVPYTSIIHDRAVLELFRGCTRGCRFCQAGYLYRPVRNRRVETLVQQARELIDHTGYDEISLTSLSSGDYPELEALLNCLSEEFEGERVSLSLPSLRIDSFLKNFAEGTSKVRKSGLTFAPEAGTQRLRDVINKGVTEEDLMRSVRDAFESGYSSVKLYFMMGLPTETDEDLLGIIDLAKKVVELYYEMPKERRLQPPSVAVSVATFVPKGFTPFQWYGQIPFEEIKRRQGVLKDAVRGNKRIKLSMHDARVSFIEAVVARGDRRLARVIERVHELGGKFDGWDDKFSLDLWMQAFEDTGIDPSFYANRKREMQEIFPFEHIDIGVEKGYLVREYEKSLREELTRDCRNGCNGCGMMALCKECI